MLIIYRYLRRELISLRFGIGVIDWRYNNRTVIDAAKKCGILRYRGTRTGRRRSVKYSYGRQCSSIQSTVRLNSWSLNDQMTISAKSAQRVTEDFAVHIGNQVNQPQRVPAPALMPPYLRLTVRVV